MRLIITALPLVTLLACGDKEEEDTSTPAEEVEETDTSEGEDSDTGEE